MYTVANFAGIVMMSEWRRLLMGLAWVCRFITCVGE